MRNIGSQGRACVKPLLLVLMLGVSTLAFPYPINASAQSLSQPLTVQNQTTGETIVQYQPVPPLRSASALGGQNLNVTTVVYEDRFGREENNGGWNVFLRTTFSNGTSSTSGINLRGD